MEERIYRYYKPETRGLDQEGLLEDLSSAKAGDVVLLHACAHNPTGLVPSCHSQMPQVQFHDGLGTYVKQIGRALLLDGVSGSGACTNQNGKGRWGLPIVDQIQQNSGL